MRIVVFNEGFHERAEPDVAVRYPAGIGGALASAVAQHTGIAPVSVTQDDPGYGAAVLSADILLWWGHARHDAVPDELADRLHARVLAGMTCSSTAHTPPPTSRPRSARRNGEYTCSRRSRWRQPWPKRGP
jgi:trehalose utilization protein